jgi:hypothetical protein
MRRSRWHSIGTSSFVTMTDGSGTRARTSASTRRPTRPRASTRTFLIIAAFGANGAILLAAIAPFTASLAAVSPPLYALVAGVHSVLPFTARRLLAFPAAATLVGLFVGVLAGPFSPIGLLVIVPLVSSGAAYDLTLALLRRWEPAGMAAEAPRLIAGAVSAGALFAVSLPVMSPEHLLPPVLLATLAARLAGQLLAVTVSGRLAILLRRAGIARRPLP